ncbi:YpfJ protein, zinc metalloprotease superfamily protein [Enhygromyxa salina]|uniref:YpfJ protein, zinc metalloprotease superfamily protein n=1 Tax=Enhygromyxa salina TaxID=215803 RepID=A0A0C1ZAI3_9BACT|nr:neutral zinc metallopeptidase [Enhygromyxa salina]KIG14639.1 YpfJ protein, zinc metalloprotease superfamily protein [Enhygromyxa salina]
MRWDPNHRSSDLIDRRSEGGAGGGGGLLFTLLMLVVRSRWGWAGVIAVLLGYGALQLFGGVAQQASSVGGSGQAGTDEQAAFVGFVLDDAQDSWARKLPGYRRAELVLFRNSTRTACGFGDAATGPFYCPADQRVYIDLSFYDELERRLGAGGDFAQAYVIAHEIGHHVQNLNGTSERVHRASGSRQRGASGLSVRLELQADCYAGVWAHDAQRKGLLEVGDIDEALTAAAAIGDDRLQRMGRGTVSPETFTHGTSAQRVEWFRRGYERGDPRACDSFSGAL